MDINNTRNISRYLVFALLSMIVVGIVFDAKVTNDIAKASYGPLMNVPWVFNNTVSHPIQTAAAAANGFQLSATDNASVFYSINVNTTATIGGSSDGYVVLEISPTNSSVAANWIEISRSRNGQSITLAIALQSVQNIGSELMGIVPAGYYARLRSVNVGGTPTYTFVSGQEVVL